MQIGSCDSNHSKYFTPNLPPEPKRELGLIGRFVERIRVGISRGIVHKVAIYALLFFASIALWVSIVGNILFIPIYKEFILQNEREMYDAQYKNLVKIACEHSQIRFLEGRLAPLNSVNFVLTDAVRNEMRRSLHTLNLDNINNMVDRQLLKHVALNEPNYLTKYRIQITNT